METERYILDELETMLADCEREHISPEEWIEKNAVRYFKEHVDGLDAVNGNNSGSTSAPINPPGRPRSRRTGHR